MLDLGAGCGDEDVSERYVYIPSDLRSRDFAVLESITREIRTYARLGRFSPGSFWRMCDPHLFLRALRTYNTSAMLSYTASDLHTTCSACKCSLTSRY